MTEQNAVLTNAKTITSIVEYFVMTKYIPSVQTELARFLTEYDQKRRTLDMYEDIVGVPCMADLGVFQIKEPTQKLIADIMRAFNNQLSPQEVVEMKESMLKRLQSKKKSNDTTATS